jgi:hypothetical protein
VLIVRATRKLLDRTGGVTATPDDASTTVLGDWYATALFWRPQVAMFVNARTLLPVLVPLAPAATVAARFSDHLATTLDALGTPRSFTDHELAEMTDQRLAPTASRSVLGTMNDFAHLAGHYRHHDGDTDLVAISLWLAGTPCGPLRRSHDFPDRELAAVVAEHLADRAEGH